MHNHSVSSSPATLAAWLCGDHPRLRHLPDFEHAQGAVYSRYESMSFRTVQYYL